MKIGFITTVLNEDKTIDSFLASLLLQTKKPDEVIIVDGGSSDDTIKRIKSYELRIKKSGIRFKLFVKKGNISKGRNFAVKNSTCDVIAISDAGCVLDKNWLRRIAFPFKDKSIDVVAGFYKGLPSSNFQKCLVPFVLVMPDKATKDFLPASRSMAIRKKVFEKVGGFSEKLKQAEDYDFAKRLKKNGAKIVFEKGAIVSWVPRSNIISAFKMFYKYAYGDIKAGSLRPKVLFIFARYLFAFFSILAARFVSIEFLLTMFFVYFFSYSGWSIYKNYKYVKNLSALFYLPLIQFASDLAVISGTTTSISKIILNGLASFVRQEKIVSLSVLIFTILTLSVISWGLPNTSHPFTYHMDEWHQLQSVRAIAANWSPIVEGAAHGPMFFFIISGIYIGILYLLGLVNPFIVESSVGRMDIQNLLFIYLRTSTLLFSLGAITLLIIILKKYFNVRYLYIPLILFMFSPNWIALSNYFKYDIAIVFWILLSIFALLKYTHNPVLRNYLLASIPVGMVAATKLSGLPMFAVYLFSYIFFTPQLKEKISFVVKGTLLYIFTFLLIGVPNIFLGKADYRELLRSVVLDTPMQTFNFKLGMPYYLYLFTNQVSTLFGFSLTIVFILSILYFIFKIRKISFSKLTRIYKYELFFLFSAVIFSASLYPLKLFIYNRALVVLPFIIIFIGLMLTRFMKVGDIKKNFVIIFINFLLVIHIIQGVSWIFVKFDDPRQSSSAWILENIEEGSTIGIETPPIYQFLPDIVLKEYYTLQEDPNFRNKYNYEIVSGSLKELPRYIIVTNKDIDQRFLYSSPKKDLLSRMNSDNYSELMVFEPNWWLSNYFTGRLDFFVSLLAPSATITIYEAK